MNKQLESSLMFAAQARDIGSLKSLARQESDRADQCMNLIAAIAIEYGEVRISRRSAMEVGWFSLRARGAERT
jgi:hypothetical protein